MFFGLPCVATNVWAIPEIVRHGETGFICEPDDANGLAQHLVRLLRDPDLAFTMGRAGRARAETHFTWAAVTAKMTERIARVIGHNRRRTDVAETR